MPKLTKKIVDSAPPKAAKYFIWCSDLPGFGVRIFPSGRAFYYADYRNKAGIRKRISIGHHGKLTTEEARKEALVVLGGAVRGTDPAEERATRRASLTVADLCESYFQVADKGLIMGKGGLPKKASTLKTDKGRVARHITPLLGNKLVIDLTQADLNRFVRDVAAGKTAVVEKTSKLRGKAVVDGGNGTAARTAGMLGGILSFAVSEGIIAFNPARGVKRPADKSRNRRLTADEYRNLGKAIDEAEMNLGTWQATAGIRLLALTGCRLGEVVGLKWSEFDAPGQCLRLEDSKEGRSVRPIGMHAVAILSGIERDLDNPYVLPSIRGEGHYAGMPGAMRRLTKRAGLSGVTAHTLRHSFASTGGDLGFADSTISALIGHSAGTVTSRYIHHIDAVLIAAADRVAGAIEAAMTTDIKGAHHGSIAAAPNAR